MDGTNKPPCRFVRAFDQPMVVLAGTAAVAGGACWWGVFCGMGCLCAALGCPRLGGDYLYWRCLVHGSNCQISASTSLHPPPLPPLAFAATLVGRFVPFPLLSVPPYQLLGGYLYFHKAPNAQEFFEETRDKVSDCMLSGACSGSVLSVVQCIAWRCLLCRASLCIAWRVWCVVILPGSSTFWYWSPVAMLTGGIALPCFVPGMDYIDSYFYGACLRCVGYGPAWYL